MGEGGACWTNDARRCGLSQYRGRVPELPEVEALVVDLSRRLDGRAIVRVDIAAFSCLKTYDPPVTALAGGMVDGVSRHGKFLDIDVSGTHLILHLARAGYQVRFVSATGDEIGRGWHDGNSALNTSVLLEERIAVGDPGCRVVVYLGPVPAEAEPFAHHYLPPSARPDRS